MILGIVGCIYNQLFVFLKQILNMINEAIKKSIELQNQGEWDASINLLKKEVQANKKNTVALYSLALGLFNTNRLDEAYEYICNLIKLNSIFVPSYILRSNIFIRENKIELALEDAKKALSLEPKNQDALALVAKIQSVLNVNLNSSQIQGHLLKGIEFQQKLLRDDAKSEFEKALSLDQNNFFALYSLGVVQNELGSHKEALAHLERAALANPTSPLPHFAIATIYMQLKLYDLALSSFDSAINCDPKSTDAYNNKAVLLRDMHKHLEALETLDSGLKQFPDDLKTLSNKAYLLTEFKQHVQASTLFKRILEADPSREYALGLYAYSMLHTCNWEDFEENSSALHSRIKNGDRVINPLAFMAFSDDGYLHKHCAESFGHYKFPPSNHPLCSDVRYVHQKKRVGFISADFREHPVGYLFAGLLEQLDRNKVETYGFSLCHGDGSELYKRFKSTFDNYITCEDKNSSEIAEIIKQLEIDVLIDLNGYTSGSRLEILAMRPAPVQMTYLGFPGTLGLPYIDYLIADWHTVPSSSDGFYAEKVLRLSSCYLPRDLGVLPAASTSPRTDFELPDGAFVFCSFNHEYKITPPIFKIWMDLLKEVEGSVLWLMRLSEDTQTNLCHSARSHGVDPTRLIFAKRVPRIEDHLARYRHVDLCLDTFPYNGHTTTSDALFMGVPVVTLAGSSFASRVATSLLYDVGLSDQLSCTSLTAYKGCAMQLATQQSYMNEIRKTLSNCDLDFWRNKSRQQADEFSNFITQI
jgi:protein O-GlcNAc transferase